MRESLSQRDPEGPAPHIPLARGLQPWAGTPQGGWQGVTAPVGSGNMDQAPSTSVSVLSVLERDPAALSSGPNKLLDCDSENERENCASTLRLKCEFLTMHRSSLWLVGHDKHASASFRGMLSQEIAAVQSLSHVWLFTARGRQLARLPCPSPSPGACSNSCPPSRWCHPTISSSVVTFSSCLQSFPASGSFPVSQLFASGGQSTGASVSVLPVNIQDWSPLGWTGWISLLSKGLSRVFSNTTVQKHQFFGAQPSLCSNSHIHTWLLEKTALTRWTSGDPCGGNLMWGIQGATVSLQLYYKSKAIQSKMFI